MITRRSFARKLVWAGAAVPALTEAALAQRALTARTWPPDTIWLNANENPEGPCRAAIEAVQRAAPESWQYHFQEFRDFQAVVAHSEQLDAEQVLTGAGSTEVLDALVAAFTSPARPLITPVPTFEAPAEFASALDRRILEVPLDERRAVNVRQLAEAASRSGGGLIYLCNPNNPTSLLVPKADVDWLAANLPPETVLLVDEAYLHFVENYEEHTALGHVRQGRDVVVARTFSKIYGMAGLRVGFACAKPELIARARRFRNNPISVPGMRAALAALGEAATLIPERRARLIKIRSALCEWLHQQELGYLEPSANFIMIDVGMDARDLGQALLSKSVAVGRPFPPLNNLLRVTIGTGPEMAKFREAFLEVYQRG